MSLKGILRKAIGAFARSKTGRSPTRSRPVSRHQSTEGKAIKSVAKMAKKKL